MRVRLAALIPEREHLPTLALYAGAGAVYVVIGLITQDFLLSMPIAIGYLLIVVWLLPGLVRRLR